MPEDQELKFVYGRGRNNLSDVYKLPADSTEMDRLSLQHRMWKLLIGGLYPPDLAPAVHSVMHTENGAKPYILDIGSGSGTWAIEMAQQFPDAEIVGLDLVKNTSIFPPPNCRFITGDLTEGLSEFQGAFDIVHTRSVVGHLLDPAAALKIIAGCLKPGGLVLYADGDLRIYNEKKELVAAAAENEHNEGRSWFASWMQAWGDQTGPHRRLGMDERVLLLKEDSRVDQVTHRTYFCPANWDGNGMEHGEELGEIMKTNLLTFVRACKPNFLTSGYDADLVERWVNEIQKEMEGPTIRLYIIWHVTSAFRKA